MANRPLVVKIFKVVFWCILYYTFGSISSVFSKTVLKELPYPTTLSVAHLIVAVICLYPSLSYFGVQPVPFLSKKFMMWRIIPLAAGKILASVSSHVSLWKVPVSYAHTVKALLPIFAVSLSVVILKERPTLKMCISLIPIAVGVIIATVTELQFDVIGMLAALTSTLFFALQNVYSKKSLREVKIHHLRLLLLLSQVASLLLIPFWLFGDFWSLAERTVQHGKFLKWIGMLSLAGLLNLGQNVCAFSVLSFMTPTSYSIVNVTKRMVVITVSILMLRNPVTMANISGMAISIFGVLLYNKAKLDNQRLKTKESFLPLHGNDTTALKSASDDWNPNSVNGSVPSTEFHAGLQI